MRIFDLVSDFSLDSDRRGAVNTQDECKKCKNNTVICVLI